MDSAVYLTETFFMQLRWWVFKINAECETLQPWIWTNMGLEFKQNEDYLFLLIL